MHEFVIGYRVHLQQIAVKEILFLNQIKTILLNINFSDFTSRIITLEPLHLKPPLVIDFDLISSASIIA